VIDLAGPVARADQTIVTDGLGHRPRGSFNSHPAGVGGYVLTGVLHDWDDEHALRALQRCAGATSEMGKVLSVVHFGDAGGTPDT